MIRGTTTIATIAGKVAPLIQMAILVRTAHHTRTAIVNRTARRTALGGVVDMTNPDTKTVFVNETTYLNKMVTTDGTTLRTKIAITNLSSIYDPALTVIENWRRFTLRDLMSKMGITCTTVCNRGIRPQTLQKNSGGKRMVLGNTQDDN